MTAEPTAIPATSPSPWRLAGLVLVFIWFFLGGIGHFALTGVFTSVTPAWVPMPREVVLATGVCEIFGALALLHPKLRRPAGLALILLAICVTPVHIDMLTEADPEFSAGRALLWVRLIIQPVLIWIIWVVTQPQAVRN
ncbi:MAG: hypothetical protein SGJ21_04195 [Alphaproteobacteria bacterium]|nr:hypothetical protein [Alphaproteobacteria bacterium]